MMLKSPPIRMGSELCPQKLASSAKNLSLFSSWAAPYKLIRFHFLLKVLSHKFSWSINCPSWKEPASRKSLLMPHRMPPDFPLDGSHFYKYCLCGSNLSKSLSSQSGIIVSWIQMKWKWCSWMRSLKKEETPVFLMPLQFQMRSFMDGCFLLVWFWREHGFHTHLFFC